MIIENIQYLINEIQNKPSIEVLDKNRIDITNDVAMIIFKTPN